MAVKDKSPSSPTPLTLRRTTLARHAKAGLLVFDKGGTGGGAIIEPVVEASILWDNGVAIDTDYDPARIVVRHSDLETDLPVSGDGNLSTRPAFVAPERGDFRLNPLSPAATAGPDGGPIGWPGWGG